MPERRHLSKADIRKNYGDKFSILVRFMIVAAENKRFVTYTELNKILGVALEDLRDFAGLLGYFCQQNKLPLLNSLIINSSGKPGDDYFTWLDNNCDVKSWEKHVADCLAELHLPTSNKVRFINTSGLNEDVTVFLERD